MFALWLPTGGLAWGIKIVLVKNSVVKPPYAKIYRTQTLFLRGVSYVVILLLLYITEIIPVGLTHFRFREFIMTVVWFLVTKWNVVMSALKCVCVCKRAPLSCVGVCSGPSSRACEGFELVALLDVWGAVRSRQRDCSDLLTTLHTHCLIEASRDSGGRVVILVTDVQLCGIKCAFRMNCSNLENTSISWRDFRLLPRRIWRWQHSGKMRRVVW
jgi:hypothetical protein